MTARGKREARRPWFKYTKERRGLKGRNSNSALSGLHRMSGLDPGATSRQSRDLPLAFISRAFGAGLRAVIFCAVSTSEFLRRWRSELKFESKLDRAWATNLVERVEAAIGAACAETVRESLRGATE